MQKKDDEVYTSALEKLVNQGENLKLDDIHMAQSPFNIESLQKVAKYFGSPMLEAAGSRKQTLPLVEIPDLFKHFDHSDIQSIPDDD